MAKKEIKNLTSAELLAQNKVLDEQREFTIDINGQAYKMSHDVTFRKTKKSKLLDDVVEFFSASADNIGNLELATPYITLLAIKHFTSMEVSNDVSEALALLEVLIDLGILGKIIEQLPEDEMMEVYELVTEGVNRMAKTFEENEEEIKELMGKIENQEVKDMMENGNL